MESGLKAHGQEFRDRWTTVGGHVECRKRQVDNNKRTCGNPQETASGRKGRLGMS